MAGLKILDGKYEVIGLSELGEFQYGRINRIYDHRKLTEAEAEQLVKDGYPHLKKAGEEAVTPAGAVIPAGKK